LPHVDNCERDKYRERDDFLQNLELRTRERAEADAIGGHLPQVLEQRDTPTD
jgi:hypothetical protein